MTAINSNRAIRGPVTAVPVVAGKGVRLVADTENNRWVVEADETVLWEGTPASSSTVLTMSETWDNFEKIEIHFHVFERRFIEVLDSDSVFQIAKVFSVNTTGTNNTQVSGLRYDANADRTQFSWVLTSNGYLGGTIATSWNSNIYPTKIIGINRIASN